MLPRRPVTKCRLLLGCVLLLLPSLLPGQTAVPDESGRLVFKANARTVVIDVVVTEKNGKPAHGLHQDDFIVTEDGHPQKIASFEEHSGARSEPTNLPDLPPNIFTNIPRMTPTDSVTVLLLDSLNTPASDQSYVHMQMLKYLKGLQPGRRMAIFTLGNQLRFVQGFTADPAVLIAALNSEKNASGPQASPLLQSRSEVIAQQQALALIAQAQQGQPSAPLTKSLRSLQQYQADQSAFQTDERVNLTLDAFQQLGRYLAGIPGRKNVVWLSGSFPLNLLSNPDLNDSFSVQRDYLERVQKTNDQLTAAEISVYPIAAEGLINDTLFDASNQLTALTDPNKTARQQVLEQQNKNIQGDVRQRNADHTAMELIAKDTGGEAIYNVNDLNEALARVVDHGSSFYTVAYTPTNPAPDGRFRKLHVKLVKDEATESTPGHYKLAYRRGYYAMTVKGLDIAVAKRSSDPLHPFMGPGMPESTQIPFALRVKPEAVAASDQPAPSPQIERHEAPAGMEWGRIKMAAHADVQPANEAQTVTRAGDNDKLKGPLIRYAVDFVIAASGLRLDEAPNGTRSGSLESTMVVYDQDGRALNWMVRQISLDMDAARYAQVKANGANFRLEIDVPKTGVYLRSGIYDRLSNLTGTLEIPLGSVLNRNAPGLKTR